MHNLPLAIIGTSGQANVIFDICQMLKLDFAGFIGKDHSPEIGNKNIIGGDLLLDDPSFIKNHQFIIGIGDNKIRYRLYNTLKEKGAIFKSIIHPFSSISSSAIVSTGTVICAGAIVGAQSFIGENVILNTGSQVDHDCHIEHSVHIAPKASLAGSVRCGYLTFIGTGSTVINNITIGSECVVGAGSVVVKDINSGNLCYGVPCKTIRKLKVA